MNNQNWIPHHQIQDQINQARNWLIQSGVIAHSGAVTAWLAPEDPTLEFISSEITGYATSYLCWQNETTLAQRSAAWLINTALDQSNGSIRCRFYNERAPHHSPFRHDSPIRWTFDAGIVLQGLLHAYQLCNNTTSSSRKNLAAAIQQIVEHLLHVRQTDHTFAARWNVGTDQPAPDPTRWSAQSSAFHAKIDRTLLIASQTFGKTEWVADLPQRVDQYIAHYQTPVGAFTSYAHSHGIHTHPHLYACEGLWIVGQLTQNTHWIAAAQRGIEWLISVTPDGRVPRTIFDGQPNYHGRGDAQAQYLRGLLIFDQPAHLVQQAYAHLCQFINADGALVFGWNADGRPNNHPDTWGTIAAIQALTWLHESSPPDPQWLI